MPLATPGSPLRSLQDSIASECGISPSFIAASEHPYSCKCYLCKSWWRYMGPDPDSDSYGPFTKEEIEDETLQDG